ncbi:general transcription factor II-I repeat domain-containing protein 2-like [Tachysurus ichikawai]
MKIVEYICPKKKQEFANVCLARNTVGRRIEDVSSDIKRQLEAKAPGGVQLDAVCVTACPLLRRLLDRKPTARLPGQVQRRSGKMQGLPDAVFTLCDTTTLSLPH